MVSFQALQEATGEEALADPGRARQRHRGSFSRAHAGPNLLELSQLGLAPHELIDVTGRGERRQPEPFEHLRGAGPLRCLGVQQVHDDLIQHIHLENNLLFPQFEPATAPAAGACEGACSCA